MLDGANSNNSYSRSIRLIMQVLSNYLRIHHIAPFFVCQRTVRTVQAKSYCHKCTVSSTLSKEKNYGILFSNIYPVVRSHKQNMPLKGTRCYSQVFRLRRMVVPYSVLAADPAALVSDQKDYSPRDHLHPSAAWQFYWNCETSIPREYLNSHQHNHRHGSIQKKRPSTVHLRRLPMLPNVSKPSSLPRANKEANWPCSTSFVLVWGVQAGLAVA